MIIFHSGEGSRGTNPEWLLPQQSIMLSYAYVMKPSPQRKRFRKIRKARKEKEK